MKRLTKTIGLITSGLILMGLSSVSFAVGTAAGTNVENIAVLNFQVGGVNQDVVRSAPGAGNSTPGAANGTFTTFAVDRILDLTVTTVDTTPVDIGPGANNGTNESNSIALQFTVANTGNATQNIALQAVNTAQTDDLGLSLIHI